MNSAVALLRRPWAVGCILGCALTASAAAQDQHIQAGLAGWPGLGMQVTFIDMHTVYSLESGIQVDVDPFEERRTLTVAGSVGAAFLPLNVWRTIGQADYGYDLDLGLRLGPRLRFVEEPTRADKNRQFSLFLDPFLRLRGRIGRAPRIYFVEIGPVRPSLRVGLLFGVRD